MEDKKIKTVINWLELKSMRDIQVFLSFANFYQHFIQSFSKIARPLTLMLKTSFTTQSGEYLLLLVDVTEDAEVNFVDGSDCEDKTVKRSLRSKNSNRAIGYLTPKTMLAFIQLTKTFIEAPILQYLDLEYYIKIETNVSSYVIGGILISWLWITWANSIR